MSPRGWLFHGLCLALAIACVVMACLTPVGDYPHDEEMAKHPMFRWKGDEK